MVLEFVKIKAIFPAVEVIDGAGVKLKDISGTNMLMLLISFCYLTNLKVQTKKIG
jgi:hypothetical protein